MKLTQKLLGFLNRVFDKDPHPFLAVRLQYDGGMTWAVADGVLTTAVTGGSGQDLTIDLSLYRVADLISFLAAQPGYAIAYGDQTTLSLLSALVLLDGTGDISKSNGDHLYGYTSFLWSYMEANAAELQAAAAQIPNAIAQMSTKTAQDEWLDLLGGYYSVKRLQGELDASYGPRIIAEVLRPRGNNVALEAAIKVYTGQSAKVTDVTLYGPTSPLHNGATLRDGSAHHNATATPIYGLFDVQYGYDFINGGDISSFQQIVAGIIDRLRDAGMHMRSLQLQGSTLTDALTPPSDAGAIQWGATAAFADTLATPDDSSFGVAGTLAQMADALVAPSDSESLAIAYNYQHSGLRRHNGVIYRVGGLAVNEQL